MIKRLRELFSITALSLTICLTFLVALIFLISPSFLGIVELKTGDMRFRSRRTIKAGDAILLAVIDEKSLGKKGIWPCHAPRLRGLSTISQMTGQKS